MSDSNLALMAKLDTLPTAGMKENYIDEEDIDEDECEESFNDNGAELAPEDYDYSSEDE